MAPNGKLQRWLVLEEKIEINSPLIKKNVEKKPCH
jgi:hypothetical protein